MSMELSVWSSYYMELSPEDAVRELLKHGYTHMELSDEHAAVLLERDEPKVVGREFGEFCKKLGMTVSQGHLYLKVRLCNESEPAVEILKNWLDMFIAIGIKNAVLHCDSMANAPELSKNEKMEKNACALKQLTEYLKGTELSICLENLRGCNRDADEILWYIEKLGSENLAVCLDTGHLNLTNGDQVEFIKKVGSHLKALHIADNEGERDQHMMPFGRGNIDFFSVVAALKNIGYKGLFNLEIPGESHGKPTELKGYKLDYIRKMYDYLMNGERK